jgi:uncharacterized protein (DUF58 family)
VGSSIDFQDHRPYVPGDDPRHVDWRAYARSGNYLMKLYREEVSPSVDVVIDASASMSFDEEKRRRSLALFFFAIESALRHKSALNAWVVSEKGAVPAREDSDPFSLGARRTDGSLLETVPFRPGSLRVVVSDVLFLEPSETLLRRLVSRRGHGVVLAPSSRSESSPEWLGQVDLEDCETGARRLERVDARRLEEYQSRYRNHFATWEAGARRYGVAFASIPGETSLKEALRDRALPAGAVEPLS